MSPIVVMLPVRLATILVVDVPTSPGPATIAVPLLTVPVKVVTVPVAVVIVPVTGTTTAPVTGTVGVTIVPVTVPVVGRGV